jgi:hypothetical protein
MIDLVAAVIWLGCAVIAAITRNDMPWWINAMMCILLALFHLNGYFGHG